MKLGIDFGSTYSTLAHFDHVTNNVETITMGEGLPASIPSVVSITKKSRQVTCGNGAQNLIGRRSVRIFEAFKMLLTETDAEMLSRRGYDGEYTPREITRLYLESLLKTALQRQGEELLLPTDSLFSQHPILLLKSEKAEKRVRCGNPITLPGTPDGTYRIYSPDRQFLCLSQAKDGVLTSVKNFFGA